MPASAQMSLLTDEKLKELVLGSHYLSGESPGARLFLSLCVHTPQTRRKWNAIA